MGPGSETPQAPRAVGWWKYNPFFSLALHRGDLGPGGVPELVPALPFSTLLLPITVLPCKLHRFCLILIRNRGRS